jgi:membrane protein
MRFLFRVGYEAYSHFSNDDGWAIASHIALSVLMALFPFLIFVTALAAFLGSGALADEAIADLFETWPKEVAAPLAGEVREVLTQPRGGLLTIGGLLAVFFASSGVEALRVALNRAYDVKEHRPWWLLRIESIGYVFVGAFAMLTWAFLVVLAPLIWSIVVKFVPALAAATFIITVARVAIASAVLLLALLVIHMFLPAGKRSFREVLPGIILTFLLWVTTGIAYGSYLAEFARNYVSTYAGLASAMIALAFLYMLSSIFILGGEINAALVSVKRIAPRSR